MSRVGTSVFGLSFAYVYGKYSRKFSDRDYLWHPHACLGLAAFEQRCSRPDVPNVPHTSRFR